MVAAVELGALAAAVVVLAWFALELLRARRWHDLGRFGDDLLGELERIAGDVERIADALEAEVEAELDDRTRPLELDDLDDPPPA